MKVFFVIINALVASSYAGYAPDSPNELIIDSSLSWRIVGGSDAPEGRYPHQIILKYKNGNLLCSGSIIDAEWVVTAAHCVKGLSVSKFNLVAGTNKLKAGGQQYAITEIHYHERYNGESAENDVAILKVAKITFNDKVAPISLERDDVPDNVTVIVSGWGKTSYPGGKVANNLQQLTVKTFPLNDCKRRLAEAPHSVTDTNVCTITKSGEGACHGDSGGPLIKETKDGKRTLVGIVSWGKPCAIGYPDVFARVSSFFNWFNSKCNCLN